MVILPKIFHCQHRYRGVIPQDPSVPMQCMISIALQGNLPMEADQIIYQICSDCAAGAYSTLQFGERNNDLGISILRDLPNLCI